MTRARFARSLREAFPAERYAALEVTPPVRRWADRAVMAVTIAAAIAAAVLMIGGV